MGTPSSDAVNESVERKSHRETNKRIRDQCAHWLLPSPRYTNTDGRVSGMKRSPWPTLIGCLYIGLIGVLGGLSTDHVMIGALGLLDLYNEKSRSFLRTFFPFILTGVLYDFTRYFYWPGIDGRVRVVEPYFRDLRLFGIRQGTPGETYLVTPNEFLAKNSSLGLDLVCGFAYLAFVGQYLALAFVLFFKKRLRHLRTFGWSFFAVNFLGYLTYFVYPAAPPWYVEKFGFGPARMYIQADAAAAARFDRIMGTQFFDEIYARGIAVYGAYPSLHVAYPLLVTWMIFLLANVYRNFAWLRWPAVCFYLLMCLSAVYLQHHYVFDVLLGSLYAIVVATIATVLVFRGDQGSTILLPRSSKKRPAFLQISNET